MFLRKDYNLNVFQKGLYIVQMYYRQGLLFKCISERTIVKMYFRKGYSLNVFQKGL